MSPDEPVEIRLPWGQILLAFAIFFSVIATFGGMMAYLEDRRSEAVPLRMIQLDSLDRVLKWKADSMGIEAGIR
jgi:hypothetical protein